MAVATFDTLKYANTLKAGGVPPQQAEAQAVALGEALQVNFKELVTKDDLAHGLKDLEQRLTAKIDGSASKLDAKIDGLGARLDAKIDGLAAQLRGEIALLRYMFAATFALGLAVFGLLLRLSFRLP